MTSDRSSWCLRRDEEALNDNWQRTARHYRYVLPPAGSHRVQEVLTSCVCFYSREDYETPIESTSWYRAEDCDHDYPGMGSKYSEAPSSGYAEDYSRPRGGGSQTAIKTLSKYVSGLKKKIRAFEEEFEASFGYRPSHSDKMKYPQVKKQLSELSKSKKELKRK